MLTPIQTRYAGHFFRSRLEARWAVFFDAMGIVWEYEKEGYDLGDYEYLPEFEPNRKPEIWKLGYYLPDFWLPQVNMWAEVKGQPFTEIETAKCLALAHGTQRSVILLDGLPDDRWYSCVQMIDGSSYDEQLFVSNYHNYHIEEHRFYGCPGSRSPSLEGILTPDIASAIIAARSARFEHGESGAR